MVIGSLLYAFVNVLHLGWLIRSNFRLRRSENLHELQGSHQNLWIYPRVKMITIIKLRGIIINLNQRNANLLSNTATIVTPLQSRNLYVLSACSKMLWMHAGDALKPLK